MNTKLDWGEMMDLNIPSFLRNQGIKASYQRIRIYEYLMINRTHPTVAEIYDALITDIPSLSKTTVYNTLNLFVEKELVEEVTIEGSEMRYDIKDPEGHGHFKCTQCHRIFDVPVQIEKIFTDELSEFHVQAQFVHFVGICPDCLKKNS